MSLRLFASALIALGLSSPAFAGPWEDGVQAYKAREYETALRIWLPMAIGGDANAENNVGVLYEKGLSVQPDYQARPIGIEGRVTMAIRQRSKT